MSDEISTTTVHILDKKYDIKCRPEEVADLQQAVQYLEQKMREISIQQSQRNIERLAINTALNLCHELLLTKRHNEQYIKNMSKRLHNLHNKIEASLSEQREIELN